MPMPRLEYRLQTVLVKTGQSLNSQPNVPEQVNFACPLATIHHTKITGGIESAVIQAFLYELSLRSEYQDPHIGLHNQHRRFTARGREDCESNRADRKSVV